MTTPPKPSVTEQSFHTLLRLRHPHLNGSALKEWDDAFQVLREACERDHIGDVNEMVGDREFLYGYYFSFTKTGDPEIDAILQAIAQAGSGCHHTEDWTQSGHTAKIQHAAIRAAATHEKERQESQDKSKRWARDGTRIEAIEQERDTLKAQLNAAPHSQACDLMKWQSDLPCNCWKSRVMEG